MKHRRATFRSTVEELKIKINRLLDEQSRTRLQSDEWLRTLYESYSARFIHDNDRIWTTGSIMIPLSLAAFAAFPSITCPKFVHLLILGIASQIIIISWLVIAENQRAFQDKSRAWLVAIEEVIGLEKTGGVKLRGNRLNRLLTFSGAVQKMRWGITFSVILGWIMVWMFWPRCP